MTPRADDSGVVAETPGRGALDTMDDTTSTRSLPWFRCYTSLTRDIRFRRQPVSTRWAWIAVLSMARRCSKPGYLVIDGDPVTVADLADEACISIEEAQAAFDYFETHKYIKFTRGSWKVQGWERHQFTSDTSTKRVQKHRSKAESVERSCNVSATPPEYRVQSTDTEIENPPPKTLRGGGNLFDEWPPCLTENTASIDGIEKSLATHILETYEQVAPTWIMQVGNRQKVGRKIIEGCAPDCAADPKRAKACAQVCMEAIEDAVADAEKNDVRPHGYILTRLKDRW